MSDTGDETAGTTWPDLAGRIVDGEHVLPVRIYHEDTDFTGLVYHAAYVRFMERGRSDMLRVLAISQRELAEEGDAAGFVVRRMTIDYRRPARIEDVIEVRTSAITLKGASITLYQSIWTNDTYLVGALVQVALIAGDGRPLRIGGRLRAQLASAPRSRIEAARQLMSWRH